MNREVYSHDVALSFVTKSTKFRSTTRKAMEKEKERERGGGRGRREMQGGRDRVNEPADGEVAASRNAISA